MRSYVSNRSRLVSRVGVAATCLLSAVAWSGCEAKEATEYVGGISTQVSVPRDLKAIRIDVSVGGFRTFCQGYRVYDGKVQLPRSLGAFANTDSAITSGPITYTVAGVTNADLDTGFFANCDLAHVGGEVRILRRSRQPYIPEEIRFLPMPIKYSCYDKDCGEEETCKAGKCVSATLTLEQAKAKFPVYTPDLADGTGGTCFSTKSCMGLAAPALQVDKATCTFALANTASEPPRIKGPGGEDIPSPFPALPPNTPWDGLNVEVTYDGGLTKEILDLDDEEGFSYAYPEEIAKPNPDDRDKTKVQKFKLAPGLCEMFRGLDDKGQPTKHRITAVRASGTCQPKKFAQPFCLADNLEQMGVNPDGISPTPETPIDCATAELKPPRSALLVVVDNTVEHQAFFNKDQLDAIDLPLQDPAFEQTEIGLSYAPGAVCAANTAPTVPLEFAATVREKIIGSFNGFVPGAPGAKPLVAGQPVGPSFEGALTSAYAVLKALPSETYFRRAVVVIGNRAFNTEQCATFPGKPADLAAAALNPPAPGTPINTFVIQLAKANPNDSLDVPVEPGLLELRNAGAVNPTYNPDARGTKKNAKDSFQEIINSLATCVYDVDTAVAPSTEDTLSYTDPLLGLAKPILASADCSGDAAEAEGWRYAPDAPAGKKRIFLCKKSCSTYQGVLRQASDFALLYQQPPIAVPIFSHKAACAPK